MLHFGACRADTKAAVAKAGAQSAACVAVQGYSSSLPPKVEEREWNGTGCCLLDI